MLCAFTLARSTIRNTKKDKFWARRGAFSPAGGHATSKTHNTPHKETCTRGQPTEHGHSLSAQLLHLHTTPSPHLHGLEDVPKGKTQQSKRTCKRRYVFEKVPGTDAANSQGGMRLWSRSTHVPTLRHPPRKRGMQTFGM